MLTRDVREPADPRPVTVHAMRPRAALAVGLAGFALELVQLTPWMDRLASDNDTVHFTQHGLVFAGGLLMGWALRDLRLIARANAER